jgi:hypothetical protein
MVSPEYVETDVAERMDRLPWSRPGSIGREAQLLNACMLVCDAVDPFLEFSARKCF